MDDPINQKQQQLLPGTAYVLEEIIGEGGGGQVFIGRHVELDKKVAIKVLKGDMSKDPVYEERFRREARAASRINHPSIVNVTDFGRAEDGRLFLVMELVEGETLSKRIAQGPLSLKDALLICSKICDVLAVLHAAGIIHRDVKPANVFLMPGNEIKIVDFGIAKVALLDGEKKITKTGVVHGTPGYIAPEHARGYNFDGRADLYSVGVILYEMLTGINPFPGDSALDILIAQINGKYLPITKLINLGQWNSKVDKLIETALKIDPEMRFESGAEMSRQLQRIIEEIGDDFVGVQCKETVVAHIPKKTKKSFNRIWFTIILLLVVIMSGLLIYIYNKMGSEKVTRSTSQKTIKTNNIKLAAKSNHLVDKVTKVSTGNKEVVYNKKLSEDSENREKSNSILFNDKKIGNSEVIDQIKNNTNGLSDNKQDKRVNINEAMMDKLISQKKYREALSIGKSLLRRNPDSVDIRMKVASIYYKLGNTQRAVEQWRKVLKIQPDNQRARGYLEMTGFSAGF